MAPQCPKCSTILKDDYGMVTCPSCGNIVFVDMEGMVHVTSDQPPATEASQEASSTFEAPAEVIEASEQPADISPFDLAPMDISPMEPMAPFQPVEETSPPEAEVPSGPSNEEVDMNAFLGYAAEPGDPSANPAGASQNDPNDPLGISAYANSEMSSAQNGPLVVSLIISGIDAKDLRDEIRQALQDSRFGWDTAALMAGIKGGVLRIDRVSPVKATIVINRIKNLSVRIRWEQSAITEIDPVEKEI